MITFDPLYLLIAASIVIGLSTAIVIIKSRKKFEESGVINETGYKYRRKTIIN